MEMRWKVEMISETFKFGSILFDCCDCMTMKNETLLSWLTKLCTIIIKLTLLYESKKKLTLFLYW